MLCPTKAVEQTACVAVTAMCQAGRCCLNQHRVSKYWLRARSGCWSCRPSQAPGTPRGGCLSSLWWWSSASSCRRCSLPCLLHGECLRQLLARFLWLPAPPSLPIKHPTPKGGHVHHALPPTCYETVTDHTGTDLCSYRHHTTCIYRTWCTPRCKQHPRSCLFCCGPY